MRRYTNIDKKIVIFSLIPIFKLFRLAGRLRSAMPVLKHGTRNKSVTTTTDDDDGQKHTPLIVGAPFSFWSFFIDLELMSNLGSLKSQISSFESYTFLRRIQNENTLNVGIQFFFAWVSFLCSTRMISFFTSIGPPSRTIQF